MTNSLDDFYDKYTPEKDSTMREFVKRKRDELLCHKLYYHDRTGKVHILPITKWLCKYNCEWFKKDFIAGITVAILLVPQSLAYAQLAGLPPEWGLYASIIPLIIYTLLGTSTQVSIGPVAPTAIMVSSCIEDILKDFNNKNEDMPKYELLAMMVSFNVGLILFIFGIFRAGRFITIFLSKPIMTGFISAAALIIFIEQVKGLLGMKIGRFHLFSETLMAIIENLSSTHALTCAISFPSLFILFIPKFGKCISCISKIPKWIKIPIPLFVILINILLSYFLDFDSYGIIIVGSDIQKGFPTPIIPHYKYFIQTFFGAFIVAIVSYMGSLALATQFEQQINNNYKKQLQDYYNGTSQLAVIRKMPTRQIALAYNEWEKGAGADDLEESLLAPVNMNNMNSVNGRSDAIDENGKPVKKPIPIPLLKINANSEFIAYGLANMIGAFFGSQAVSASFSRSALNFEMNAYTAMSMVIQATICLLCLLFAMPLLSPLPKCILSALVTVSVYRLINNGITEFKFLYAVSKIELFEFSVALIAPLIVGLEMGIFVAIFSSIFVNFILRNSSVCVKVNHLIDVANNDQNNDNDNENNNNVFVTQTLYNQIVNQTDNTYDNDNSNINDNIIMIELNAQMSYINSKQLIKTLQQLISAERNKHILYIIISLNLTAFVDTTTLRQICSLFQDLKTENKYITFANCKLSRDDVSIGISYAYIHHNKTIKVTGIHLKKMNILNQHQIIVSDHNCQCLNSFISIIDDLHIGNPDDDKNRYKAARKEVSDLKTKNDIVTIENQQLKNENKELKQENSILNDLKNENDILKNYIAQMQNNISNSNSSSLPSMVPSMSSYDTSSSYTSNTPNIPKYTNTNVNINTKWNTNGFVMLQQPTPVETVASMQNNYSNNYSNI